MAHDAVMTPDYAIYIYIYVFTINCNGVFTNYTHWVTDIYQVLHGRVRAGEGVLKLCTSHSPVKNIREY